MGYSPWGRKEPDSTEATWHAPTCVYCFLKIIINPKSQFSTTVWSSRHPGFLSDGMGQGGGLPLSAPLVPSLHWP